MRLAFASLAIWLSLGLGSTYRHISRAADPLAETADAGRRVVETPITDSDRDHWSFQPLVAPAVPLVKQSGWPLTTLDCFVLAELEAEQLDPASPADPATWLRRVKLDLLGLPPTPEEVRAFLADSRPDAYERVVDQWLASPRFGERWAQYWLDLARFAETDGFEHDKVRSDAWRYRDWVIRALNEGVPYDRFVGLQLTADLHAESADPLATMFCLAGPDMPDINEQDVRRHDRLNEVTSTVGAALLGLQLHCAQCHDHKYDPLSQADFYRLRAVFESSVPDQQRDRPFNVFDGEHFANQGRMYYRGDIRSPGPLLEPGFPRIASPPSAPVSAITGSPRIALVDWLFGEDNPLTARVIANRVWQYHFGKSLVENPSDFGVVAGGPSHPELLDWLASGLRERQWSLKALHREIVLSATYRQASFADTEQAADWHERLNRDPEGTLYSRFPRHRLQGETIRDCMLSVAGLLDYQAGGESVMPPLPIELRGTLLKGQWQTSQVAADHYRRSIYIFARRNMRFPIFDAFDRPDAGASCACRSRSTTAIQSLQMLNSELAMQCAEALAERLQRDVGDATTPVPSKAWIDQLFLTALGHPATTNQQAALEQFFEQQGTPRGACLAILNSSEFLYTE